MGLGGGGGGEGGGEIITTRKYGQAMGDTGLILCEYDV